MLLMKVKENKAHKGFYQTASTGRLVDEENFIDKIFQEKFNQKLNDRIKEKAYNEYVDHGDSWDYKFNDLGAIVSICPEGSYLYQNINSILAENRELKRRADMAEFRFTKCIEYLKEIFDHLDIELNVTKLHYFNIKKFVTKVLETTYDKVKL